MRKNLAVLFILMAVPVLAADINLAPKLAEHWKTSKAYIVAIAEQMPASDYGFKPVDAQMSFGEQMAHIASSNLWFLKFSGADVKLKEPEKKDKESVIKYLNESFDAAIKIVEGLTPEQLNKETKLEGMKMSGFEAVLFGMDHITHHRGQCIVYLRLKNNKPADYRF